VDPRLVRALAIAAALAGLAMVGGLAMARQPEPSDAPPPAPESQPPPPTIGPTAPQPAPVDETQTPPPSPALADKAPVAVAPAAKPKPKPVEPTGPPKPVRGPTAVLQVLDKVTAETLRFEAPVGRRVRYKNLVVEVKACETRDLDDPRPNPSAYLVVNSLLSSVSRRGPPQSKEVFKGWMFANAPGVHALQHPIYDLWLIACSAALPPA
jgi:hypothetical protein